MVYSSGAVFEFSPCVFPSLSRLSVFFPLSSLQSLFVSVFCSTLYSVICLLDCFLFALIVYYGIYFLFTLFS